MSTNPRVGGKQAHEAASPKPREEPSYRPTTPTKFGYVQCPTCEHYWTGLSWGDACPVCGTVRMHEGNWFPWIDGGGGDAT